MDELTDASTDWVAWHQPYGDPASSLSKRLAIVQAGIDRFLDQTSGRDVRVVSACAGDGRDLLGVLERRAADRSRVHGTLVELDPTLAAAARDRSASLGLDIDVVESDAGDGVTYAGLVPADLVLLCGIFGNVSDGDVELTVRSSAQLCAPGATLMWTRHTSDPDLTPSIRRWFTEAGFEELGFSSPEGTSVGVGVQRLVAEAVPLVPARRLFTFQR